MKDEKILPIIILIFCLGGYFLKDYLSDTSQIVLLVLFISSMLIWGIFSEYKEKRKIDKHHIIIYIITFIGLILFAIFREFKNEIINNDKYTFLGILIPIIFVVSILSVIFHGVIKSGDKEKIKFLSTLGIIMIVLVLAAVLVVVL